MVDMYQDEINRLDELIRVGGIEENNLRTTASEWKADADGMKIRKYGKDNQTDLADRERKYRKYEDYIRLANIKADEIAAWKDLRVKQMDLKTSVQVTENDVSKTLAGQGFTRDTLKIKETANADVTRLKGSEEAANIAKMGDVAVKSAEIDNKAKNNQVILVSAAAAIVIIVIGVVVWKKYKSKKK